MKRAADLVEVVYAMRSPVQYVPSPLPMNDVKTPGIYTTNVSPMYQGHLSFANNMRNAREEPMQTDVYLQGSLHNKSKDWYSHQACFQISTLTETH